ncbi:AraC family transcriptional regulator [Ectobacillus ponti]|uniref:AraC family transcriptional regulator n=1 Tax=Ectobacillus ponti TaxID=2961894 RepID=A0AA42BRL3_9BACI|nr:AraC family transcriptional regulator [Ectobacillus ponti]MCP8970511.1 AraC family transcriptional regulator [Ectobacillus ponti]
MQKWLIAGYRMQGAAAQAFQFHSHHEYEIYFFHSGECKYLINNRIYDLQPGDIFIMDGRTLHKPNPRPDSLYTRSVIHFSPTWLRELLAVLGISHILDPFQKLNNCLLRTGCDEGGRLVDEQMERITAMLIRSERQAGKHGEHIEAELKLELVQLLLKIYDMSQKQLAEVKQSKTEKEHYAESIAAWIDAHYAEKISLDRLAHELNLSKYYASHVFKEVTGFTVMEYVMGCRLNQAKYLLEMEPVQTVAEVSHAAGFESVSHFSRYFKEKTGVTPANYRKHKTI